MVFLVLKFEIVALIKWQLLDIFTKQENSIWRQKCCPGPSPHLRLHTWLKTTNEEVAKVKNLKHFMNLHDKWSLKYSIALWVREGGKCLIAQLMNISHKPSLDVAPPHTYRWWAAGTYKALRKYKGTDSAERRGQYTWEKHRKRVDTYKKMTQGHLNVKFQTC